MGCGDACPVLPGKRYEDWMVGDPALASPAGVAAIGRRQVQHLPGRPWQGVGRRDRFVAARLDRIRVGDG